MDTLAPHSREAAAAAMARLDAARVAPQLPWRDLAPYAAGNFGIPYAFSSWDDPTPPRRLTVLAPEIATTADVALLFRPESFAPYPEGAIVGWDGERPIRAPFDGAVPLWIKQTFVAGQQAFMWARHE
jgi:hypothetical protein